MLMAEGLDTGDMLLKRETSIGDEETAGELHDRLMLIGAELLIETLDSLDEIEPQVQDDEKSSYAPMLKKELGHINWENSCDDIHNLIRGVSPWPGAYAYYGDSTIKIWKAKKRQKEFSGRPGEIIDISREGMLVSCSDGSILITELQEVGGKKMDIASYMNGHNIAKGQFLR
jgi:methionyl-tRNA formyltransferase